MGPKLKVSSDRLVKPVIEPVTHSLQGEWSIYYTTAAQMYKRPVILSCLSSVESFSCGDPEKFVRGGPTLNSDNVSPFFLSWLFL